MERTKETLEARVRETPLVDRLKECQKRIGNMCAELRGPKMSIPVEYYDDDFYICTTLADAQATVEALQAKVKELEDGANALLNQQCSRLAVENQKLSTALSQVEALQRERDEADKRAEQCRKDRAMVLNVKTTDGLTASEWLLRTAVAEQKSKTLQSALDAEREKVKALEAELERCKGWYKNCLDAETQLSQLQALVRALPVVEGPVKDEDILDNWESDRITFEALRGLLEYRATLDATTPAVCLDCGGDGAVDSGGTDPNGNPLMRRCGCREKGGDDE